MDLEPSLNELVLIGPARSGTTLVCRLLNKLSNVVALDEPFSRDELRQTDKHSFSDLVASVFLEQRDQILSRGCATSTQCGRQLTDHYDLSNPGLRSRVVDIGAIELNKSVKSNFLLVIKHTIPFAANAGSLITRFRSFALIRNPLAILASWNSIDAAYREGRVQPYAARFAPELTTRLSKTEDRFMRQVMLLDWHFERFALLQKTNAVVRYEDIIATNGKALDVIVPNAMTLNDQLECRNTNSLYDRDLIDTLTEKLLVHRGAVFDHYSVRDIEALRSQLLHDK